MEDEKIISLYLKRDENAITETKNKYHKFLLSFSYNILRNTEDSEECVSDTYLGAWQSIPPEKPMFLKAYLSRITRNISLKKLRFLSAKMRKGCEADVSADELAEIIPDTESTEDKLEAKELGVFIDSFLRKQKKETRVIFLRRYFFFDTLKKIAADYSLSESAVKMRLSRVKKELYEALRKENLL